MVHHLIRTCLIITNSNTTTTITLRITKWCLLRFLKLRPLLLLPRHRRLNNNSRLVNNNKL
jgi:hypothetical protein